MVLEPRVLLTKLQPDTTYIVRVRTLTPLGPGPFSPDHEFRTSPPGRISISCPTPNIHNRHLMEALKLPLLMRLVLLCRYAHMCPSITSIKRQAQYPLKN